MLVKICLVTFPDLLESKFLEWQHLQGKRKTLEEFATYIGVSRPLLNMWMNGHRKPGKESLKILSATLGNEVYDVLGYPRPNPYLQKINQVFEQLSPEHQRQLAEQAEKYQTKNDNGGISPKRRRTSTKQ